MIYCACQHCGTDLEIDTNVHILNYQESKDIICPVCYKIATKVRANNTPVVNVRTT